MRWRRNTSAEEEYVSWRDADMRVTQKGNRRRLAIRVLAVGLAVTGFVVLLMDVQRDPNRCHQSCFDGSDRTFESGHVWTAYFGSWQWDAQLFLGWAAFCSGLWALWAAGRRSRWETVASLSVSIVLIGTWIVWLTVQPPPGRMA
jgi:hypothetical protein